uniref:Macro domain-containing protein n=1 Tax=Rhodosorus marinus TaxID=101924 RepID=A0A7S3A9P0_9RHOD|mmetsp:Transcript_7555/g.33685  ORF Transcript_7555/g.33685 Transcript_7555/m.33685 type:complete len:276 (+) Transcript_7555:2719-3546(+)
MILLLETLPGHPVSLERDATLGVLVLAQDRLRQHCRLGCVDVVVGLNALLASGDGMDSLSRRFLGRINAMSEDLGFQILKKIGIPGIHARSAYLYVGQGSVADFRGEALVNSANEQALTGGGIDGIITRRGGPELEEARARIPIVEARTAVRVPVGQSVVVGPAPSGQYGTLRVQHVVLSVGPNYNVVEFREADSLLSSAYATALQACKTKNLKSIGFPLISAGVYCGSRGLHDVLRIGVRSIFENAYEDVSVYLVAYTDQELETLLEVVDSISA